MCPVQVLAGGPLCTAAAHHPPPTPSPVLYVVEVFAIWSVDNASRSGAKLRNGVNKAAINQTFELYFKVRAGSARERIFGYNGAGENSNIESCEWESSCRERFATISGPISQTLLNGHSKNITK